MRRDAIDFGSDSIPALFRKILVPTLLGMLCMSVMTTIDGVFVGHGAGSDALAAVNIFAPFWLIMSAIGLMLRYLGEDGVAAFSVACYIMPFVFMTGNSIAQSAQPIISYNHGAGNTTRVREARRVALMVAIGMGIVISLAMVFGIKYVAALFLERTTPTYSLAADGIPLMAAAFLPLLVNVTIIGYFQSVERALPATVYSLARGIIFLIPSFIVMPRLAGDPGIWLALPVSEVLTLCLIAVFTAAKRKHA